MRRILAVGAIVFALAGCVTPYPGEPASAHDEERSQDAFALQIDTGRVGIFNDRIGEALDLMPNTPEPANETPAQVREGDLKRAQDNVRSSWFAFLAIRTRACTEGKFTEIACAPLTSPAWLAESAATKVDPATVVRRLDELQDAMAPLLDAACEKGKALSKNENPEMFCSVE